jgi:hypothetical protein
MKIDFMGHRFGELVLRDQSQFKSRQLESVHV